MRHQQTHEPNRPRDRDPRSDGQRHAKHQTLPQAAHINAEALGRFFAEHHHVQARRTVQE